MRARKRLERTDKKIAKPNTLFKYLHADRIDILENNFIRFTQPELLNDPFEVSPKFIMKFSETDAREFLKEHLDEMIEKEFKKGEPTLSSPGIIEIAKEIIRDN